MSIVLTQGRDRYCKESIGGVNKIWLAPFVNYFSYEIIVSGNILTEIPATVFHQFVQAGDAIFNEPQRENEGGKFHEQNISFDLPMILDGADAYFINNLMKTDYRVLFEDRNGVMRIFGLYNGVTIESINQTTGGAKPDFNGYRIIMKGEEEKQSYYVIDIDGSGAGGDDDDPPTEGISYGFLLLETGDFLLLEDGGKIIL